MAFGGFNQEGTSAPMSEINTTPLVTNTLMYNKVPYNVLADFAPVPYQPLPYRSILVASSTDPYCPIRLSGAYARSWGSEFVRVPDAGHLNVKSGHGPWPLGVALLQSLTGEGGLIEAAPTASVPAECAHST